MTTEAPLELSAEYLRRFGGIARLFGRAGLQRLSQAHVAVIGVGGVGSWTAESLARSGVGALTLIDLDDICVTNTNRQLPALEGSYGQAKVDVLRQRAHAINPDCQVEAVQEFFTATSMDYLLEPRFDFVIDAIDKLINKCLLIAACRERGLPVLAVGGAGGRRDGTAVRVGDLAFAEKDNLLKAARRKLRLEHGFSRDSKTPFGVPCVYSTEPPVFPWADGTVCEAKEPDSNLTLDCASGYGTASFVTAAFGFAAAGEVVKRIALGEAAKGAG